VARMAKIIPDISFPFLLTIVGVFTAWSTFFLVLSDRYLRRIGQAGIRNLVLKIRLYALERFIFTELLFLISILALIILAPIISALSCRFLFLDENVVLSGLCGSGYIALAVDSIIVFSVTYNVNRFHRSLRHDERSLEFFRTI
jgi:hypothetical protein